MKTKTQSKKPKKVTSNRRGKHIQAEASGFTASKPAGPPLEGEALERKVAEVLCQKFRRSDDRENLRKECGGAEDSAIEAAIVSPRVQNVVKPVAKASSLEHAIAVLQLILLNAKAALESEKPTAAQIIALKIIVEAFVGKMMELFGDGLWKDSAGVLFSSDFERSVVEDTLRLIRQVQAQASYDPPAASEGAACANPGPSDPPSLSGEC